MIFKQEEMSTHSLSKQKPYFCPPQQRFIDKTMKPGATPFLNKVSPIVLYVNGAISLLT